MSLEFNFKCYDDDAIIIGTKSSGKTYLANKLLQGFKNINVVVYDFNFQFFDSHAVVIHTLEDLFSLYEQTKGGHFIFQPFDKSEQTFTKFCEWIFNLGNCVCLIDEIHQYVSKMRIPKAYNDLVLSGRPRGISVISISSRPQNLPNNALNSAKHIFAFKLNLESDIVYLESWLGAQAWELLPQDQRKKNQQADMIPEHSFYYRDTTQPAGVIGKV